MKNRDLFFFSMVTLVFVAGAQAEHAGYWDFESDRYYVQRQDGFNQDFQWSVSDGMMHMTMTREGACERVYIPLVPPELNYDNSNKFLIKSRFRVNNGAEASVLSGFFAAGDGNLSGTNDHVCLEFYGATLPAHPAGWGGGSYEHGSYEIDPNIWYVMEMTYKATDTDWYCTLYDGAGEIELDSFTKGTGGLDEGVNVIGFGNEDRSGSESVLEVDIDWFSWDVANPGVDPNGLPGPVVVIHESDSETKVEEGAATDTVEITLAEDPGGPVTITLYRFVNPGDFTLNEGTAPVVLSFDSEDWETPQIVSVEGVVDGPIEGEEIGGITVVSSVYGACDVIAVCITDLAEIIITESGESTDVSEQGETFDSYNVRLSTQPSSPVTVNIADMLDPDQVLLSTAVLNFTDTTWSDDQMVTVTAIDDDISEDDPHNTVIRHTASSSDERYEDATADVVPSIADNDCGAWGYFAGDANRNCEVDLMDLAILAAQWLQCTTPNVPGCVHPSPE